MKYRKPLTLSVVIAAVTLGIAAVQAAAPVIVPPSVPSNLEVPAGSTVYLVGHARDPELHLPAEGDQFCVDAVWPSSHVVRRQRNPADHAFSEREPWRKRHAAPDVAALG